MSINIQSIYDLVYANVKFFLKVIFYGSINCIEISIDLLLYYKIY